MAKIYVSEYSGLGITFQGNDSVAILPLPANAEYTVVVTAGVSVAAQAIQASSRYIEISTDTTCSFVIGTAGGNAALTNCRLQANERIIRRVPSAPFTAGQLQIAFTPNFILTTSNV